MKLLEENKLVVFNNDVLFAPDLHEGFGALVHCFFGSSEFFVTKNRDKKSIFCFLGSICSGYLCFEHYIHTNLFFGPFL